MTSIINGLPVFEAVINMQEEDTGMYLISIVDNPAICKSFEYFSEKEVQSFSILSQEQRIIRGCVMRANFPIYRRNAEMGEFYISFSPETIRIMSQKYLRNGFQNQYSLMHNGKAQDGVEMIQFFIKDIENGVNPKGFEDCEDGSLFCECKVLDDTLWNEIKEGKFSGFSLECITGLIPQEEKFSMPVKEEDYDKEIRSLLGKLYKKLNN